MRGMQTRQRRREAEAADVLGPHAQSGAAPAQVHNDYFEPLLSGRDFNEEYDESKHELQAASRHLNAQHASTRHANAQSAANPSMTDADTLARAFTQYANMSGDVVSHNVPEKKALAVAKYEKPKWDTKKEPFHTFKRRVMI